MIDRKARLGVNEDVWEEERGERKRKRGEGRWRWARINRVSCFDGPDATREFGHNAGRGY